MTFCVEQQFVVAANHIDIVNVEGNELHTVSYRGLDPVASEAPPPMM